MICSICQRKFIDHTLREVRDCTEQFRMKELERHANKLCISCGSESDLLDPDGSYWCNSCLAWQAQLNDEGSDARIRKDLQDE